jgi:hypothetical protein
MASPAAFKIFRQFLAAMTTKTDERSTGADGLSAVWGAMTPEIADKEAS